MGFFSVPRLPGWSFQHPSVRAGGSTSRKPPVISTKSIIFHTMTKIVKFFKGLLNILLTKMSTLHFFVLKERFLVFVFLVGTCYIL
ncbi:MAG: hypothetical protein ACQEQO_12260 [Thermodesulfobacteriota bacterium]